MSIKEAKKHLKEGDDALKTGLFKWSKDYASAAMSYDEAAKMFKQLKDYDMAIVALEKCSAVNVKINDPWGAGRNYEAIVNMSLERQDKKPDAETLVKYLSKTNFYFRSANSPQTYSNLVKKVAKAFEEKNLDLEACNLYKELINDLETDEQSHVKSEIVQVYAGLLVKLKRYNEAIDLFEREFIDKKNRQAALNLKQNLDSLGLTIICLNLIVGDVDNAERRLQNFALEIKDFIRTPEFDASEKMIEAYIDGKQEDFDKNSARSVLNNIFPLNIIKDVRKVKVKAQPQKRKVIELEGATNNGYDNNEVDDKPEPPVDAETKKAALDDFLC